METKLLSIDLNQDINLAIDLIAQGELVAVPTETVYGLAADAQNVEAVNKIFKAKERPSNHPLIVHLSSLDQLSDWVKNIPKTAQILADHFWPGPLTLVFEKKEAVNTTVTGGLNTIAIRVPKQPALRKILEKLNSGLAAPSANPHKRISPTAAKHVLDGLSGKIAAVLDGGRCEFGLESTIVDLTGNQPKILRHGPINQKMLEEALGEIVDGGLNHQEPSPGNMKQHYQPYTKTLLLSFDQIKHILSSDQSIHQRFAILHYSQMDQKQTNVKAIKISREKYAYAKHMYEYMHELDQVCADQILIESPPQEPEWLDIYDRLSKAAANIN